MRKKRILKKSISLVIVCCFLSGVHITQSSALEQQKEPLCEVSAARACEDLWERLTSPESGTNEACINEAVLENFSAAASDLPGLIVIYNIFMFIYYGRLCLETLDPTPCGAMVNHLVIALFLGILLEGF
jgi:hypothetical protein